MDLNDYQVPHVRISCRSKLKLLTYIRNKIIGSSREAIFRQCCFNWLLEEVDWTENCLLVHFMLGRQVDENEDDVADPNRALLYHISGRDNFIRFGREEFCLLTGLRFGDEYREEYGVENEEIPFRRRVFPSCLDGSPISGADVQYAIENEYFDSLDDEDAVNLCCLGIVQLVLLGKETSFHVPTWMLRLVNNRFSWNHYPWGSYVWTTLYHQLRNANYRRWPALYASEAEDDGERKSYSLLGFIWAFKTWILESFPVPAMNWFDYEQRSPRIVSWSRKKKRFLKNHVRPFFEGHPPLLQLGPRLNEQEADWWINSRSYFEGEYVEPVARPIPRGNMSEIPSSYYKELQEQRRDLELLKEKKNNEAELFEQMRV